MLKKKNLSAEAWAALRQWTGSGAVDKFFGIPPKTPKERVADLQASFMATTKDASFLKQANQLFGGSKKKGWKTPRGRMYIQLGPPLDRDRYPAARRLQPLERWVYQSPPHSRLPKFFEVLFYKRYGVGVYELYDPLADGPEKLVGGF